MNDVLDCGPVVIGGGVIGFAIAAGLARTFDNVVLVEAESGAGYHTSSRNSEVIHSGIYYTPGSLKSELCLSGKAYLYDFLNKYDLPYNKCGKLIVSDMSAEEDKSLQSLCNNADSIGVKYNILNFSDLKKDMPIKPCNSILVHDTGFFDSHAFLKKLQHIAKDRQVSAVFDAQVERIEHYGPQWSIYLKGKDFTLRTRTIVNSAGLHADKVAELAGFNKYKIYFYKGEYYKTDKLRSLKHLLYSVPPKNQMSLGIHTRSYLDGSIGFGPNAYAIDKIDYSIDESNKQEFLKDINKYLDIHFNESDIYPDYAGIRPKINSGGFKADFNIRREDCDGDRVMISLVGIESPGLTCSLSIAEYVETLIFQ
jgi:L-2-hydroxyglutarate oxidase LhgO